jgi:glucose 1-dehydrogenase
MRFVGKVCMVTGGGSGIGRATCKRFASEGGKVVVVDISEEGGNETLREITSAYGGQTVFMKADVSVAAQVETAVSAVVTQWGKIDVLVNGAAIMTHKPLLTLSEDEWDQLMAVNLRSIFLCCKYCLPHMQRGAIVNISSVHAHQTTALAIPYATSKGGIEAFTRGLSREIEATQARVNSLAPGAVNTPMLWSNPKVQSGEEKIEGVIAEPEDIAAAISFLASDEARFINGTTLVVNGGRLVMLS